MPTLEQQRITMTRIPTKVHRVESSHVPGPKHGGLFCWGSEGCRTERTVDPLPWTVMAYRATVLNDLELLISRKDEEPEWVDVTTVEIIESHKEV